MTKLTKGQAIDRYLKLVSWARQRYTANGCLVASVGGKPSAYTRIEHRAARRYLLDDKPDAWGWEAYAAAAYKARFEAECEDRAAHDRALQDAWNASQPPSAAIFRFPSTQGKE